MLKSPEIEPEIIQKERRKNTESGYSEKEQAKRIEGSQMDLARLRKAKVLAQKQGDKAKVLVLYKAICGQMHMLIDDYVKLVETDMHQAQRILEDILKRQAMQEKILRQLLSKEESSDSEDLEKELHDLGI